MENSDPLPNSSENRHFTKTIERTSLIKVRHTVYIYTYMYVYLHIYGFIYIWIYIFGNICLFYNLSLILYTYMYCNYRRRIHRTNPNCFRDQTFETWESQRECWWPRKTPASSAGGVLCEQHFDTKASLSLRTLTENERTSGTRPEHDLSQRCPKYGPRAYCGPFLIGPQQILKI